MTEIVHQLRVALGRIAAKGRLVLRILWGLAQHGLASAWPRAKAADPIGFDDIVEALQSARPEELDLIAARQADFVSGSDPYGQPWVFHAIDIGSPASLEWMLQHNAILRDDRHGRSPLQAAIERSLAVDEYEDDPIDPLPMIAALVAHGASLNAITSNGLRPLQIAASLDAVEAAGALLCLGADPALPDGLGRNALDYATSEAMRALLVRSG